MRARGAATVAGGLCGAGPDLTVRPWAGPPSDRAVRGIRMDTAARAAFNDAREGRGTRPKVAPARRKRQPGDAGVPKFGPADSARIRAEYDAGATVASLAQSRQCGGTAIRTAIRTAGGAIRPAATRNPRALTDPALVAQIVTTYQAGANLAETAKAHGVATGTVKGVLRRAGVTRRTAAESTRGRPKRTPRALAVKAARADRASQWAAMVATGMTHQQVADSAGVSVTTVGHTLRDHGHQTVMPPEARAARAARWAVMVSGGMTHREVAAAESTSPAAVARALTAHGHRTPRPAARFTRKPPIVGDEAATIAARYTGGESLARIASDLHIHPRRVRRTLTEHGVEIRPAGHIPHKAATS